VKGRSQSMREISSAPSLGTSKGPGDAEIKVGVSTSKFAAVRILRAILRMPGYPAGWLTQGYSVRHEYLTSRLQYLEPAIHDNASSLA
jgi:hypothetical protein